MASWKRDFASGLIVLVPILVTAYVIAWIYGFVASTAPEVLLQPELLDNLGVGSLGAEFLRVLFTLGLFIALVFGIGYLMRTAIGGMLEETLDDTANRLPGLRVVYNASKMAAETALAGTESLQKPVKVELWGGMRMTAFKTGQTTSDEREMLFMPTAPNITTGFVIEVDSEQIIDTEENVEDALTRLLSAGFGDNDRRQVPAEAVVEEVADPDERTPDSVGDVIGEAEPAGDDAGTTETDD